MDLTVILLLILILVIVAAAVLLLRKRRTEQLRDKFGPEYSRAVDETGDPRKAEAQLADREKRVKSFTIKPLVPGDRDRFHASWRQVQAEFVDDPKSSIGHADALLGDVMAARGYPVADFEQRSADLSVDHPVVVQNYRAAHDIAVRHGRGEASTEDLRQAMIHYRELFEELVDEPAETQRQSQQPKRERTRE
jgi:hypothetical protein